MIYDRRLSLNPSLALTMLACLFVFFMIATSLLLTLLGHLMDNAVALLRIGAVLQDTLMFIVPALATAMLSTRYPAWLLRVDRRPSLKMTVVVILVMLCSVPAMNLLIELNNGISLPESMSGVEEMMRNLEKAAEDSIELLIDGSSVGSLIMSVLIVGVYAGFSEELLFRGALQRLLGFKIGRHVAIWTAAFIFSAIHLQFYGFFPRLLLGAFFGYLAVWSGSIWLPVVAHVFNNSLVVVVKWLETGGYVNCDVDSLGTASSGQLMLAFISLLFIVAGILVLRKITMLESVHRQYYKK